MNHRSWIQVMVLNCRRFLRKVNVSRRRTQKKRQQVLMETMFVLSNNLSLLPRRYCYPNPKFYFPCHSYITTRFSYQILYLYLVDELVSFAGYRFHSVAVSPIRASSCQKLVFKLWVSISSVFRTFFFSERWVNHWREWLRERKCLWYFSKN